MPQSGGLYGMPLYKLAKIPCKIVRKFSARCKNISTGSIRENNLELVDLRVVNEVTLVKFRSVVTLDQSVLYNHFIYFQDSEGRGPIHVSILSGHPIPTQLLLGHPELNLTLEDRTGQTPFAVALDTKDHKSAEAILSREPNAAERVCRDY